MHRCHYRSNLRRAGKKWLSETQPGSSQTRRSLTDLAQAGVFQIVHLGNFGEGNFQLITELGA